MPRLILLGIGTTKSPRFAPAGMLVEYGHTRVGLDGGPGSEPPENVHAWLVRDEQSDLHSRLLHLAEDEGMVSPTVTSFRHGPLRIEPLPVGCAGREMYGYRITSGRHNAVWAPEFTEFPEWAQGADLMFADAADWQGSSLAAQRLKVARVVFARLGEPVPSALDEGTAPPFGEWGEEGRTYRI